MPERVIVQNVAAWIHAFQRHEGHYCDPLPKFVGVLEDPEKSVTRSRRTSDYYGSPLNIYIKKK